jgi:hypothetical protein
MQRGILCLLSVSEAGIRDLAPNVVLQVRFTVEVGGEPSAEEIALVEQVGGPHLGITGNLKVSCATTEFGIPTSVIEPHIEAYVGYAVHMMGCFSVAEMVNKVFEMEFKLPIEFQAGSDRIH